MFEAHIYWLYTRRILPALAVLLVVLGAVWWWRLQARPQVPITAIADIGDGLGGDSVAALAGFDRVTEPRAFSFPADHGPHVEYQTEWWYYTGNLQSADGREWGYQLTFFRRRLDASPPERTSAWGTTDIYFAHFAVTDVNGQQIKFADRNARGSELGLAGATAEPYRVFVRDWSTNGTGDVVNLRAENDGVAINFDLRSLKQPMLQGAGANGLSSKGAGEGNASYYYSLPRMATNGTILLDGVEHAVTGLSWMDHEWGTWGFAEGQTGWDWFGLQLDDDRDLMWGQLRRADGSLDLAYGAISNPDGSVTSLDQAQVTVTATTTWTSPHTGAQYPAGWRIQIPSENVDVRVTPRVADQELRVGAFVYWEGSVAVEGTVGGKGYVELTGYGPAGQLLR